MIKLKGRLKIKAKNVSKGTFDFASEMAKSNEYRTIINKVKYNGNEYRGTLHIVFNKDADEFVSNEFTKEIVFKEAEGKTPVIITT